MINRFKFNFSFQYFNCMILIPHSIHQVCPNIHMSSCHIGITTYNISIQYLNLTFHSFDSVHHIMTSCLPSNCTCPVLQMLSHLKIFQTGDEMSKRSKFVMVTWVGSNVSVMKKAKMSTDKALMKDIIQVEIFLVLTEAKGAIKFTMKLIILEPVG